ncbi:unnamed protein product [Amoebophrya sp. A25]|nr:unnamed protein product [Amoebophrya sp. A25]|eukprot:GSA25T00008417001.1
MSASSITSTLQQLPRTSGLVRGSATVCIWGSAGYAASSSSSCWLTHQQMLGGPTNGNIRNGNIMQHLRRNPEGHGRQHQHEQRRHLWWDPTLNRKTGRPAISKSEDVFVSKDIPVVLLKDVPRLGVKGQIVNVRRGFARNLLVPSGVAVYGTMWENIDRYADPAVISRAEATARAIDAEKEGHPMDWIGEISLRIVRTTVDDGSGRLEKPLTIWNFLNMLSREHDLDLLPENILEDFADSGDPPDSLVFESGVAGGEESDAGAGTSGSRSAGGVSKTKRPLITSTTTSTSTADSTDALVEVPTPSEDDEGVVDVITSTRSSSSSVRNKFEHIGVHKIAVEIPLRQRARRYEIQLEILSQSQEMEALRAAEEERKKNEKPQFLLGVRGRTMTGKMKLDYGDTALEEEEDMW